MTKPNHPVPAQPMYVTWKEGDDKGRALAMAQASKGLAVSEPILRTQATDAYMNVGGPGQHVRDGMNRLDYEHYRRDEAVPLKSKDVMRACMHAYEHVGVIRNVIDLMADFACQGIDLYHPNERIEKFFKEWFRRVNGKERSERFLNLLYRCGNVIIRRTTAKLPARVEEQMRRAKAEPETTAEPLPTLGRREVPWTYTFLNPLNVEVLGDELAVFVGQHAFMYGINIPMSLAKKIRKPASDRERELVGMLPKVIVDAIRSGKAFVPLDGDKVRGFYYKRDDWDIWSRPLVYSILSDISLLQKMKLADMAALDGAISSIRVWKLGDIKTGLVPTENAINKLARMLCNNVGGGVMDLVWSADIDLVETKTDVHHFLGQTKYEPVLTAIYAGLGIPPTLTGASASGGFTNNFISLKTLTERLEYGRQILVQFWQEEIRLVQAAMGFRFPASIVFDRMTLTDDSAEKQLLINLADRDLISWETLTERFGETPEIEIARLRREQRRREDGSMPPKASPFHDPQEEYGLKKIFAQLGDITPSEAGVELDENRDGQKSVIEQDQQHDLKSAKLQNDANKDQLDHQFRTEKQQLKYGVHPTQVELQQQGLKPRSVKTKVGTPGRPPGTKDSGPRKQKQVKPRSRATFLQTLSWAENAQAKIGQLTAPVYLERLGKKTLRELSEAEAQTFERYKFFVLCSLGRNTEVTEAVVARASAGTLELPGPVDELLRATLAEHARATGREPSLEVLRRYQAGVYAAWVGDDADPV
jgi:hypothetical protein